VRAALDHADASAQAAAPPPSDAPGGLLIAEPAVLRALLLVLASAPALMFLFLWLPQYLELGRGIAKPTLGRYLWLPPVMADLGMVGFGALASRMDRRHVGPRSHVELVFAAAALQVAMVAVPLAVDPWAVTLLIGLAATGSGGLYTLLTADMMARVHPSRVSLAGGLTAAAQSLVYVALNPAVGRWIDRTHSYDLPLTLFGAVGLPGALLWTVWPLRRTAALNPAR
jgi:ACS family hexuronate transporter-like MFS transporter